MTKADTYRMETSKTDSWLTEGYKLAIRHLEELLAVGSSIEEVIEILKAVADSGNKKV